MNRIKKYNLFESSEPKEDSIDYEFIRDCFLELMDDGVKVKVTKSNILGHSAVIIMVYYGIIDKKNQAQYEDKKSDLIDNIIKENNKKNFILEKVNDAIDRIMETFELKVSISDRLYTDDGNTPDDQVLEIVFVKMNKN
jgi:hypothetical protein